jgi:hypothetical protein
MEIVITAIGDRGNVMNERIGMLAIKDCELKNHLVFKSRNTATGSFSNRSTACYWFAPKKIRAGDKIVLYTGQKGNESIKVNPDGSTTHFFYWGLGVALFNQADDIVVLAETKDWQTSTKVK